MPSPNRDLEMQTQSARPYAEKVAGGEESYEFDLIPKGNA